MKKTLLFLIIVFQTIYNPGLSQVVVTTPSFPADHDSCTLIYDAALGNGELLNVSPPIYAHTGVITDLSASPSDWKYVVADWGVNTTKAQLTPLGNNKYQMKFKPSVREYYGVPGSEVIEKMAFVFRNADGSKVGRNADGSDIFVDIYPDELSINIVLPANKTLFAKQNEPIPVSAISPAATSMQILVNGVIHKTTPGQWITDTIPADNFGLDWVKHWVKIIATGNTGSVADSFSYTVIPSPTVAELPSGIIDGINYPDSSTAILSLFAPYKENVFVLGDFNDWQPDSAFYMKITPDGKRYWLQINNLIPKQEYIFQYLVDGTLRIGDPYADKVSDPDDKYISSTTYPGLKPYPALKTTGIATFLQTGQDPYPWNMTPFTPPAVKDLVIYELLIRDFTAGHDYPSLIDTLDYLKNLGVNAIELMPVMEFEGNSSWGYNPNYSFAVDKYYGTKDGLKRFVEEAHSRGISVILDIVCNHHFGSSPLARLYWDGVNQRPAANSPWFNQIPKHPYNVGNDFNHESTYTIEYMKRLIRYWLTEFRVDGYRFDLSKGFTQKNSYPDNVGLWGQYDANRIGTLTDYVVEMRKVNPQSYAIMEHFADNQEETVLSDRNMLLWGNLNGNYNEATMGWNSGGKSDFSWISYQKRGWADPNLVGYMESHDEERLMYKNITWGNTGIPWYNTKDTGTALKRMELAATFFFTIPGPKMIWQFGETGYDYSINSNGGRLAPKPIRWEYLDDWRRRYTKNIFSSLTALKKTEPVFSTEDFTLDVFGAGKRIWLRHNTMDVTVLGNFEVVEMNIVPAFTKTGMWYEFFTGDSVNVSDPTAPLLFAPGEYRLYTTTKLQKPYFTGIGDQTNRELLNGSRVHVYPNPSDGLFHFIIDLSKPSPVEASIYNSLGHRVKVFSFDDFHTGINTFSLNLASETGKLFPKGIYFFRIQADQLYETGKLILK